MLKIDYEEYRETFASLQNDILYAVVHSYFEGERCVGFKSLREAMQAVSEYSAIGVWSACFDLRKRNVVCYVAGYVYRKAVTNGDVSVRESL